MIIAECANHGLGKYFIQSSIVNLGAMLFLLTNVSSSPLIRSYLTLIGVMLYSTVVDGTLYQTFVLLLIFIPIIGTTHIFSSLFPNLSTHCLIVGGKLYLVKDPKHDQSHPRIPIPSAMSKTLSSITSQLGCLDAWRLLYPFSKEFFLFLQSTPSLFPHWLFLYRKGSPTCCKIHRIFCYC